jgi:hypothetical protein
MAVEGGKAAGSIANGIHHVNMMEKFNWLGLTKKHQW